MPRLPIYEQRVLPQGDLGGLRGYGGGATGEALQGLGGTLRGVGQQLHDYRVQDERIEVQRDMNQVQMDWMRRFDDASKAAPLGAAGFTDQLIADFSAEMDTMREGRSLTYEAMADLQARQAEVGRYLYGRALDFESTARGQKSVADVQDTVTGFSQIVGTDPGQFAVIAEKWRATVDSLTGLDAGQREKLYQDHLAVLRMAAGMALAQNDPQGVVAALRPGEIAPNAKTAYDLLTSSYGLSDVAASGVVGNLIQESATLNTRQVHDGGTGLGIAGWRDPMPGQGRKTALLTYAASNALDPYALETQVAFLVHELKTDYPEVWAELQAATTPTEAAAAFISFERPAGWTSSNPTAGHGWNNRRANAEGLYSAMTGASEPGKTGTAVLDAMPADERLRVLSAAETQQAQDQVPLNAAFDARLADATAAYLTRGTYDAPDFTPAEFDARYGPQEGAAQWTKYVTTVVQPGALIARMQTMPIAEIDAMVAAAKPAAAGPGFANAQAAYEQLVEARDDQVTVRLQGMTIAGIQEMLEATRPKADAPAEEQARWQAIEAQGTDEIARKRETTAAALQPRIDDALAAFEAGVPVTVALPVRDEFVAAFGPVDGQQKWQAFQAAQRAYDAAQGLVQQTPEEIAATVAGAQPTGGAGSALAATGATVVETAAAAVLKARAEDPAGYVMQTFKSVSAAWDAYGAATDPAAKQAAITAAFGQMDAAYDLLGQPANARPLLPGAVVTGAITAYNDETLGFEERVSSLTTLVTAAGATDQQRRIFDQMVQADGKLAKFNAAFDALLDGRQNAAITMFRAGTYDPDKLPGSITGSDGNAITSADINIAIQQQLMQRGQIGDIMYGISSGAIGSEQAAQNDAALLADVVKYELARNGGNLESAVQTARNIVYDAPVVYSDDTTRLAVGTGHGDLGNIGWDTLKYGGEALREAFRYSLIALQPRLPADAPAASQASYAANKAFFDSEVERMMTEGILWSQGDRVLMVDPDTMKPVEGPGGGPIGFGIDRLIALGRARIAAGNIVPENASAFGGPGFGSGSALDARPGAFVLPTVEDEP